MAGSRVRSKWFGLFVALVFLYLTANLLDVWVASRSSEKGGATTAIVLGAAQYNGEPSPVLRGRLDLAAELYGSSQVQLVVVTGGSQEGDVTTEAKASYDYLRVVAGIPDEDLKLEVQGTSTYESLAAVARFLRNDTASSDAALDGAGAEMGDLRNVIVVTDPYHARRSELVAREVGLDANAVVTDGDASIGRLIREAGAVSIGRIIGFRRLERLL